MSKSHRNKYLNEVLEDRQRKAVSFHHRNKERGGSNDKSRDYLSEYEEYLLSQANIEANVDDIIQKKLDRRDR